MNYKGKCETTPAPVLSILKERLYSMTQWKTYLCTELSSKIKKKKEEEKKALEGRDERQYVFSMLSDATPSQRY